MADVVPGSKPTQGRFHSPKKRIADDAQRTLEKEYIMERRLLGWSEQKIADSFPDKFGYTISRPTVANRYRERIAEVEIPLVAEVRQQEIQRLDLFLEKLQPKIEEGDPQVIALATKIAESRRKLLGTDAPQQTEVLVHTIDHSATPLAVLLEQRKAEQLALEASLASDPEDDDTQSHSGRDSVPSPDGE